MLVDTQGDADAIVHAADVQDRDGGALVMASCSATFPFLSKLYRRWRLSGAGRSRVR